VYLDGLHQNLRTCTWTFLICKFVAIKTFLFLHRKSELYMLWLTTEGKTRQQYEFSVNNTQIAWQSLHLGKTVLEGYCICKVPIYHGCDFKFIIKRHSMYLSSRQSYDWIYNHIQRRRCSGLEHSNAVRCAHSKFLQRWRCHSRS
jgi:hypothetical protein